MENITNTEIAIGVVLLFLNIAALVFFLLLPLQVAVVGVPMIVTAVYVAVVALKAVHRK